MNRTVEPLQLELLAPDGIESDMPTGPVLEPILEVHRGPDSFVTFHAKQPGGRMEDCSVRVSDLRIMFPAIRSLIERDSYFSLNSFYRPGYGIGMAGLPRALRNSASARYLNVNFVDVDSHDNEPRFWELLALAGNEQRHGVIPSPSLYVNSGRGLWLVWVLIEHIESALPPTAHSPRLLLWRAIQEELWRRLAHIGADHSALDVARIARVPGSVNLKNGRQVDYLVPGNWGRGVFHYTLEQMASFLGVEPPRLRERQISESSKSPRAESGYRALWQHRLNDFLRLRELRDGFREGTRNNAAFIYATILRANQLDERTVEQELRTFGRECKPPLSPLEISTVLKSRRTWKLKDLSIAARLQVTNEEALLIPRWGVLELPCSDPVETSPNTRRQLIRKLVAESGRWLPCREMAATLRRQGIQVGHVTVSRDFQLLRRRFPLLAFDEET